MNGGLGSGNKAQWVQLSRDHYINVGLVEEITAVERYDVATVARNGLEVRWSGGGEPLLVFGDEREALLADLEQLDG